MIEGRCLLVEFEKERNPNLLTGMKTFTCVSTYKLQVYLCALGASCRCRLLGALFVCSRSCVVGYALVGRLSVLECAFWVSCCCLRSYTYSHYCVSL